MRQWRIQNVERRDGDNVSPRGHLSQTHDQLGYTRFTVEKATCKKNLRPGGGGRLPPPPFVSATGIH